MHVEQVSLGRHGRGALDGLKLGLLIGVSLGALVIDGPAGGEGGAGERAEAALAGGVSLGLWGMPIGGAAGSRIRYRFTPRKDSGDAP